MRSTGEMAAVAPEVLRRIAGELGDAVADELGGEVRVVAAAVEQTRQARDQVRKAQSHE